MSRQQLSVKELNCNFYYNIPVLIVWLRRRNSLFYVASTFFSDQLLKSWQYKRTQSLQQKQRTSRQNSTCRLHVYTTLVVTSPHFVAHCWIRSVPLEFQETLVLVLRQCSAKTRPMTALLLTTLEHTLELNKIDIDV